MIKDVVEIIDNLSCNNIIIKQTDNIGSVRIDTIPEGAKVFIEGIQPITTPTTIDLPIGKYAYKLSLQGYGDVHGLIDITSGQTNNLIIALEKTNLFTPIIYGLIAGGILLTIYTLTRKPKQIIEVVPSV